MPRRKSGSALILIAGLVLAGFNLGCVPTPEPTPKGQGPESSQKPKPEPSPLRIAAASDLQATLPTLAGQFTDRTKVEVSLTFGASGMLAEQIKAGAPFDLFLAANSSFVKDLSAGGFIRPESIRPYARGSLVLAVRRESTGAIERLADLTRPEIKKLALANPETAPYGAAGKQALERSDLWPQVEAKVVQASSVRQALQFVESGNAEAGLVGRAIADLPNVRVIAVEPELYDPIIQALGIVARSRHPEEAKQFAEFMIGERGQSILKAAGFSSPTP